MSSAALFQAQSIAIYSLMVLGIAKRRQRKIHVPLMSLAMAGDVALIVQIEFFRGVFLKESHSTFHPLWLKVHITFAVLSLLFYILLILTGRKLLRGEASIRPRHRIFGWTALCLRSLTLATSFFAVVPQPS